MTRKSIGRTEWGAVALLAASLVATPVAAQEYPYRDVTDVVVWGAGGGTDAINRMIMAEMEKELPVNIVVTNVTGGVAGSNGMMYVLNQPAAVTRSWASRNPT